MNPFTITFIVAFGIFSRLIPHIPNFSPLLSFVLYLAVKNNKGAACIYTLLMIGFSDLLIHLQHPTFPIIGDWSLFTYSALLFVVWLGYCIKTKKIGRDFMSISLGATLFYWLWTNFGTWLLSGLYDHHTHGLMECYTLALPFLATSITGTVLWSSMIILCDRYWLPLPEKQR